MESLDMKTIDLVVKKKWQRRHKSVLAYGPKNAQMKRLRLLAKNVQKLRSKRLTSLRLKVGKNAPRVKDYSHQRTKSSEYLNLSLKLQTKKLADQFGKKNWKRANRVSFYGMGTHKDSHSLDAGRLTRQERAKKGFNSFQAYIQCELHKRNSVQLPKKKQEPITKQIVQDLNTTLKDPLGSNANEQYPEIELNKILS
ncbi:unnamed protein product [Moneuplotes crassus]|uniref:Uncharacterized protein n=1 Tax=Euplotes crassus TaxID=5936 RepID=A0AAD1XP73_EUPCR|nr:unnamed protein product [Moneuplotes crassus]